MDEMVKSVRENIQYTYYSDISMTEAVNTPTEFPQHWHLSAEFILALKDDCCFRVNEEDFALETGDVLLVWPAKLHETVHSPSEGYFIMQFSSDLLNSCDDISIHYHALQKLQYFGKEKQEARDYLAGKLQECMALYQGKEPFAETKMRIHIYEILLYLCENQLQENPVPSIGTQKNYETFLRIQSACNFIRKNCKENISQKDAASISGFSPFYFSRIFREFTQESFSEYLTRQRINNALQLLHQETVPITDVAYLSGFQSISNFSKVFKNFMNCSPLQYRKMHRNPGRQEQD